MKRSFVTILALLLLCTFVLPFAACGNNDDRKTSTTAPAPDPVPEGYILLDGPMTGDVAAVTGRLDAAGVAYEWIPIACAAGKVDHAEFDGYEKDGKTYLRRDTSVRLYGKKFDNGKVIYFSIDDGPTRDNTDAILEVLAKYNVKATFFMQGKNVAEYGEKVKAIVDAGHDIGCHSYSHVLREIYASPEAFVAEVRRYEDALASALGKEKAASLPKLLRFPGGTNQNGFLSSAEARQYVAAVEKIGYAVYDWTFLTRDGEITWDKSKMTEAEYNAYAANFLKENLISSLAYAKTTGDPLILLVHDKYFASDAGITVDGVQVFEWIVRYLVNEGYSFAKLSDCEPYVFCAE